MPAELYVVLVGGRADAVDEHQFMLRSIKRTQPGIGFLPHRQIEALTINAARRVKHLVHMVMVHADEMHRAVLRNSSTGAKRGRQEVCELGRGHIPLSIS